MDDFDDEVPEAVQEEEEELDEEDKPKTIPPELLTRILHEFFEKDSTRITKDANNTVAKYMDVFVREAIARAAAERRSGFLEVSCAPKALLVLVFRPSVGSSCVVQKYQMRRATDETQVEDLEKIVPQLLFDV